MDNVVLINLVSTLWLVTSVTYLIANHRILTVQGHTFLLDPVSRRDIVVKLHLVGLPIVNRHLRFRFQSSLPVSVWYYWYIFCFHLLPSLVFTCLRIHSFSVSHLLLLRRLSSYSSLLLVCFSSLPLLLIQNNNCLYKLKTTTQRTSTTRW